MNSINKLVKKRLTEIKDTKLRQSKEYMIIDGRLNILMERKTINTTNDVDCFFNEVINEMVDMTKQGLNKNLLNEGFFEFYSKLIDADEDTVKNYFKQNLSKWLCVQLECENDVWSKNVIEEALSNVSNEDTGRLITDCEFTSNILASAFVQKIKSSIKRNTDFGKSISNIIKKSMLNMIDKHILLVNIKESIQIMLCSKLKDIEHNMNISVENTKNKITK